MQGETVKVIKKKNDHRPCDGVILRANTIIIINLYKYINVVWIINQFFFFLHVIYGGKHVETGVKKTVITQQKRFAGKFIFVVMI